MIHTPNAPGHEGGDMVERVADAIWPLAEWDYEAAVAAARAAIEAMREPTRAMVDAGWKVPAAGGTVGDKVARRVYRAMISSALGERP